MKVAIVLFNLGGPDGLAAVRPFLRNLFNDPAIIQAPGPIRWFLSHFISFRRAPIAKGIYRHLGGKSPLLGLTQQQACALEEKFGPNDDVRTFISMRYWHPMSDETAQAVKSFAPDRIVLLPLYPQFSTTTTGSSLTDWQRAAQKVGLDAPTSAVCCYPNEPGLIAAMAGATQKAISEAGKTGKPRVLFSAHGLPKKIVEGGDPYANHVNITAQTVVDELDNSDLDWVVCYQSKVGPLEWIGPATEDEIARAGKDGVPIVVVPIAFISEHSETLVELDIEYKELALSHGVPAYHRVPAVGCDPAYIGGLKNLVDRSLGLFKENDMGRRIAISSCTGERVCPAATVKCPFNL